MACNQLIVALFMAVAATPLSASQTPVGDGAPPASETALYCLRVEAVTGTRLETVQCWTRAQWAEFEVDVDAEWAKEGVRVIG